MNILIASPVYGAVECETVTAIEATRDALRARGDTVPPWFWVRGGLTHENRNVICQRFLSAARDMATERDVLVQVDTDHDWKAVDMIAAIDFVGSGNADVVGFAHPIKSASYAENLGPLISPRLLSERPISRIEFARSTFIAVEAVGGGILVTSRRAIELLAKSARLTGDRRAVFDISAGRGEDMQFCRDWRATGGRIFCSLADVGHIGRHTFRGSLTQELARVEARDQVKNEKPMSRLLPPEKT